MDIKVHNATRASCYLVVIQAGNTEPSRYIESEGIDHSAPDIDVMAAYLSLSMITALYGTGQRVLMHINNSNMFRTIIDPDHLHLAKIGRLPGRQVWSQFLTHRGLHEVNWKLMEPSDPFNAGVEDRMKQLESLRDNPPAWT